MRAVRLLPVGFALLAGVIGCSRTTLNYTAGVCDCNPPDVTSLLAPPARPCPMAATSAPPVNTYSLPPTAAPAANHPPAVHLPPANHPPAGNHQQVFPDQAPRFDALPPAANRLPK